MAAAGIARGVAWGVPVPGAIVVFDVARDHVRAGVITASDRRTHAAGDLSERAISVSSRSFGALAASANLHERESKDGLDHRCSACSQGRPGEASLMLISNREGHVPRIF